MVGGGNRWFSTRDSAQRRPVPAVGCSGLPAHGNQRADWNAGCRFDYQNPDYR